MSGSATPTQATAAAAAAAASSRRKMVKPKMDFAKALSIMGFSTSRTLDPSGGHDAKVELNAALSRKMADIEKRKRAANKKDQTKVEDKLRDEIRTLHEAYQFLSRKYMKLQEMRRQEEENEEAEAAEEAAAAQKSLRGSLKRKNSGKVRRKQSEIDRMLDEEEEFEEYDEDFDYGLDEDNGGSSPNSKVSAKTPQHSAKPRKSVSIKLEPLKSVFEDSSEVSEETNGDEDEEEIEDEVFSAEDIQKEVSLCQLINETFKFDSMNEDDLQLNL